MQLIVNFFVVSRTWEQSNNKYFIPPNIKIYLPMFNFYNCENGLIQFLITNYFCIQNSNYISVLLILNLKIDLSFKSWGRKTNQNKKTNKTLKTTKQIKCYV